MQYARTVADGKVWEASVFAALPQIQLDEKRRNLICVECAEFAWFRKESAHGHPAHFCAHHKDECSLKIYYVVVDQARNEATNSTDQVAAGDHIKVHLDQEKGGVVDVAEVQPNPDGSDGGGTRYLSLGGTRESSQHFTLRRILHRLVQSPAFRQSESRITFYRNDDEILLDGVVSSLVYDFAEINREGHHDKLALYWGPIASIGRTQDGKIWLNSSSQKQDVSVMIYEDIADEFLNLFKIQDPQEELLGAHVLVCGRCYFSSNSGKPTIRCGTSKYIFVRRYKDDRLTDNVLSQRTIN
jgi:hypothetical protein